MDELLFKIDIQGNEAAMTGMARLKGEMMLLNKSYSELSSQLKAGKINMDQFAKSAGDLDIKKKNLKADTDNLAKSMKTEEQAFKGAEGSMIRINAELGIMRDKYRNLSQSERENVEIGGKMLTQIQAHDTQIKKLDASIGNHQRNVGNYPGLMGQMGAAIQNNIPGMGALGGAINSVTDSIGAVTGATGNSSKGMMLLGGAIGVGIAAFGGLMAASKDIIAANGDLSDSWAEMTTAMSFGWKSLTATIASGDFSNLFTNMERAIKAGKEYAKTLDELEDRTRSISMREKDNILIVDKLRLSLKNVNLTSEERQKIAQQIDGLEKGIMKEKQISAQKDLDAELKKIEAIHGVSGAIVMQFTKNKIAYKDQIDKANEYIDLEKKLYVVTVNERGTATTMIDQNVKKQMASYTKETIAFANVVKKVGNVSDESIDAVVEKYGKLQDVTHDYNVSVEKVLTTENKLEKQQDNAAGKAGTDKAKELADIEAAQVKYNEEQGRLYEAAVKAETDLNAKVEKLKLDLGAGTQDELMKIAMGRVTKTAEFERLTAEQQSKVVAGIYQQALKVSAKGLIGEEGPDPTNLPVIGTPDIKDMKYQAQGSLGDRMIGGMLSGLGITGSDEQMKSYTQQVKQQIGKLISDVTNMWMQGQQNRIQSELKAENAKVDKQAKSALAALDLQKKKGLITEAQYNAKREKLDEDTAAKKDKLAREAFEKNKKMQMLNAVINGAVAVITAAGIPVIGTIMAILTGLMVAAEIATIASTKYEGAKGGMLHGPAHRDGGIKYAMGGDVLELEGGEAVLNKQSMASTDRMTLSGTPRQIASELNGYKGYGTRFAAGGYTPVSTPRTAGVRVERQSIDEAIDQRLQTLKVYVVDQEMTLQQERSKKVKVESTW